jgi:hypothetical protein
MGGGVDPAARGTISDVPIERVSLRPMQAVSAKLTISDMIAVAAYAADQDAELH